MLASRLTSIVAGVEHDADLASPLVIAELAHHYDNAVIVTGRLGWWGPLWLLQLVRPLPGNTYFGSYGPIAATVLIPSIAALQARRLWGPVAAWCVLLISLSVGWTTWIQGLGAWSARSPSWWVGGLAAIVAVHGAGELPGIWRRGLAIGAGLVVVVCAAILLSGDQLVLAGTVVPLAAGAVCALGGRRWWLGVLLGVAALAVFAGGKEIESYVLAHGYRRIDFPFSLVPFAQLAPPVANALIAVNNLWRGGVLPDPTAAAVTTVGALSAYLGFGIVVAACVGFVARLAGRIAAIAVPAGTEPDAGRAVPRPRFARVQPGPDLQRGMWVAVWGTMLLAYLVAFVATNAQGPLGEPVDRYLFGVPLAAGGAFAPLLAGRRAPAAAFAAFALAALSIFGLAARSPWQPRLDSEPSRSLLFQRVRDVARAEHVSRGFAGYHTAYALTLSSGFSLDVTPVGSCLHHDYSCAMYLHYIDKAYVERPRTRSFLLYDTSPLGKGFPPAFATYLPTTSHPEKVVDIGGGLHMAIYGYDFARDVLGGRPQP